MDTDAEETRRRNERRLREMESTLARIGPLNRPFCKDLLRRRQIQGRAKPRTLCKNALSLWHADQALKGTAFQLATPEQWLDAIAGWHNTMAPRYVETIVNFMRLALKDLLGMDKLPSPVNKALYYKPAKAEELGRLVSNEDFAKLLLAAGSIGKTLGTLPTTEKSQALLWLSRDSGFRPEEVLSLNVGDIEWDGFKGATIRLRPEAPDLKTGARAIYVVRCVPALRVWIDMHPAGTNPRAPLFTAWRDRTGEKRLAYDRWLEHLHALAARSGVDASSSRGKPVTPHDFRHTRATEAAVDGWMEAELRAYFGWAPGSEMPARYIHLALGNMRKRVRRDAGVDDSGYQSAMDAGDKNAALVALLKELMSSGPRQALTGPPPM